jgi:hypothetical protein
MVLWAPAFFQRCDIINPGFRPRPVWGWEKFGGRRAFEMFAGVEVGSGKKRCGQKFNHGKTYLWTGARNRKHGPALD